MIMIWLLLAHSLIDMLCGYATNCSANPVRYKRQWVRVNAFDIMAYRILLIWTPNRVELHASKWTSISASQPTSRLFHLDHSSSGLLFDEWSKGLIFTLCMDMFSPTVFFCIHTHTHTPLTLMCQSLFFLSNSKFKTQTHQALNWWYYHWISHGEGRKVTTKTITEAYWKHSILNFHSSTLTKPVFRTKMVYHWGSEPV